MDPSFDPALTSMLPEYVASRYSTIAHCRFGAEGRSDEFWEETITYALENPDQMIVQNSDSQENPLQSSIIHNIPVWVIKRVLENHLLGPHADVDLLPASSDPEGGNTYLRIVCRYYGDLELVEWVANRWPWMLLHRSFSGEGGGLTTPFSFTLLRQHTEDERIPAFIRERTIVEKRKRLDRELQIQFKLCMTAKNRGAGATPPHEVSSLAILTKEEFVFHVVSTFVACGMKLQADYLVEYIGVSLEAAEAACLADGDVGEFQSRYYYYEEDSDSSDDE
jgi:hypothetical protein